MNRFYEFFVDPVVKFLYMIPRLLAVLSVVWVAFNLMLFAIGFAVVAIANCFVADFFWTTAISTVLCIASITAAVKLAVWSDTLWRKT